MNHLNAFPVLEISRILISTNKSIELNWLYVRILLMHAFIDTIYIK